MTAMTRRSAKKSQFKLREVTDREKHSCGMNQCYRDTINQRKTRLDPNGRADCPDSAGTTYQNQFPKWVFFRTRRLADIDKRIIKGTDKMRQFDAPTVATVVLDGFPEDNLCGEEQPCEALNVPFVERKEELYSASADPTYYVVGGQSTYWDYGGKNLIFFCLSKQTWCVGPSARLNQFKEGDCEGVWACSDGNNLEDHVKFQPLWSHADNHAAKPFVKLTKRPDGKQSKWNPDHGIVLDVDERSGHGPETITFRNVPPGTYQVAANIFSSPEYYKDIRKGHPTIRLFIGSSTEEFICQIEDDCQMTSRVWSVANIRIVDAGEEYENGQRTGKHRYFLRVIDSEETMAKLDHVGLGTTQTQTDDYFQAFSEFSYNSVQLGHTCVGKCRPPAGYENCMERPPDSQGA